MTTYSYRKVWAEVNLDHFAHNIQTIKKEIGPEVKYCSVIKADAYGHGALELARLAEKEGVDYLAVAELDEAIELRQAGISSPILILGPIPNEFIGLALSHQLTLTIFTQEAAREVVSQAEKLAGQARVHLKIDTGMNRVGVKKLEEALAVSKILKESRHVDLEGAFTHFAVADEPDGEAFTRQQYSRFQAIIDGLAKEGINFAIKHVANSAAIERFPDMHLDMVRAGLLQYGTSACPFLESGFPVKPVMTVKTKATFVKELPPGQGISYGLTYQTPSPKKIASLPLGYADGLLRHLSNQSFFSINGKKVLTTGSICMDQCMIDVTDIPGFDLNDDIVYFGDPQAGQTGVTELAHLSGANAWMIYTSLSRRVPRIYQRDGQVIDSKNPLLGL